MNVLVTGGAGFIGSHLVDALIDKGHNVYVVDNLSTGKKENINPKAHFKHCNILDNDLMVWDIFKHEEIEFVYHLGAAAKIPWCIKHPYESHQINVTATLRLLQLAKDFKVKGFVYSSSSSVYGSVAHRGSISESERINPINIYGLQKYTSEQYVKYYNEYFGLPTASLRYFNVYGTSRQSMVGPYANVFSAFYRDRAEKGHVTIFGDGQIVRDFVHVYDVVRANMAFLDISSDRFEGEAYNVGSGEVASIKKIAELFECPIEYADPRVGEPPFTQCDYSKIYKRLGWKPTLNLDRGVKTFFKSFKKTYTYENRPILSG